MYRNVLYLVWFKLKYKLKIKLQKYYERKRNTANERTTHLYCFDAKRLNAKEIVRQENYHQGLLEKNVEMKLN